ncbi:MAG: SGNH/GDSL hydrolase family protein, partial [Candidatus Aminicenantes bacterium]|nr:SGNH/GDSL hydrolase family protein [Candidatus Aminicenantes bacterium]
MRIAGYGGNLDLFITASGEYSHYKMCNPQVGKRFFFMQSNIPDPPNDIFLKEKPANGYRIFVLGGSTTAGYPYSENMMFSRILHQRLTEAFPDRHIEMVNTATAAINTYSLLDFMDEILANEPDAILIYAGHNEYYGAFGVASTESLGKFRRVVKLYLDLKKFKAFILIRNIIGQLRKFAAKMFSGESVSDPTATLMERLVGEQKIVFGDPVYELGKEQFRKNLAAILDKAKHGGVQILVSELVSNIRSQKPFVSVKTDKLPPADE